MIEKNENEINPELAELAKALGKLSSSIAKTTGSKVGMLVLIGDPGHCGIFIGKGTDDPVSSEQLCQMTKEVIDHLIVMEEQMEEAIKNKTWSGFQGTLHLCTDDGQIVVDDEGKVVGSNPPPSLKVKPPKPPGLIWPTDDDGDTTLAV